MLLEVLKWLEGGTLADYGSETRAVDIFERWTARARVIQTEGAPTMDMYEVVSDRLTVLVPPYAHRKLEFAMAISGRTGL